MQIFWSVWPQAAIRYVAAWPPHCQRRHFAQACIPYSSMTQLECRLFLVPFSWVVCAGTHISKVCLCFSPKRIAGKFVQLGTHSCNGYMPLKYKWQTNLLLPWQSILCSHSTTKVCSARDAHRHKCCHMAATHESRFGEMKRKALWQAIISMMALSELGHFPWIHQNNASGSPDEFTVAR